MQLKYGINPHQTFATAEPIDPSRCPVEVLNGSPSMINFLDALNGWQLVRELRQALGLPAATSFKHVSPAGVAVAIPLSRELEAAYEVEGNRLTPAALAYVRARGTDPKSSFGDFVALSDTVDEPTARFLKTVISDGVIAPSYEPAALRILAAKKSGAFVVMQADSDFEPPKREAREIFGMRLVQDTNGRAISRDDVDNVVCGALTDDAARDLVLGLIALKYTQSNSVGFVVGGQTIGIGAGQQSRVDCTKLAAAKADVWHLSQHPRVLGLTFKQGVKRQSRINWRVRYIEGDLTPAEQAELSDALQRPAQRLDDEEKRRYLAGIHGVGLVSDGFIPFRDNIDHAARHGVQYVAQPGGSARDAQIEAACREHGITLVNTGVRLFHH